MADFGKNIITNNSQVPKRKPDEQPAKGGSLLDQFLNAEAARASEKGADGIEMLKRVERREDKPNPLLKEPVSESVDSVVKSASVKADEKSISTGMPDVLSASSDATKRDGVSGYTSNSPVVGGDSHKEASSSAVESIGTVSESAVPGDTVKNTSDILTETLRPEFEGISHTDRREGSTVGETIDSSHTGRVAGGKTAGLDTNIDPSTILDADRDSLALKHENRLATAGKGGIVRLSEMQGRLVRNAMENEDTQSEGMGRVRSKSASVMETADLIGQVSLTDDITRAVRKESNKLLAADFMFASDGKTPSIAAKYFTEHDYTIGVAKAFRKVRSAPEKYMVAGSLDFDEEKIMSLIKRNEVYEVDAIGQVKTNEKGEPIPKKADINQKYRKDYKKFVESRRINGFEVRLRDNMHLFNEEEQEILRTNNTYLNPKTIEDMKVRIHITDKMILEDVKLLKAAGFDLKDLGTFTSGEFTAETLSRMRSKDVRAMLDGIGKKKLEKGLGTTQRALLGNLEDALHAKSMLTRANENLQKLARKFASLRGGIMLLGGDELMHSEMGQAIRNTRLAITVGGKAARTGYKAGKTITKGTAHIAGKIGDIAAPDFTAGVRKAATDISEAPGKAVKTAKEKINASRPGKTVNDGLKKIKTGNEAKKKAVENLREKFMSTKFGRFVGKVSDTRHVVVERVKRVVSAPFKLLHKVTDFAKRKILIPILVVCLVIMGGNLLLASLFTSTSGGAAAIITTIMSEPEQFRDYQALYDRDDHEFETTVNNRINGNAVTKNLKGDAIGYGVNKSAFSIEGYTNEYDPKLYTIEMGEQYLKGVTVNYYYDGTATNGISSNIEDCLSAMAVIMQQQQSEHHAEALELLDAIYRSTHSYNAIESALYPCSDGDYVLNYKCNEFKDGYPSATLKNSQGEVGTSGVYVTSNPWTKGQKLSEVLLIPDDPNHSCESCMLDDPDNSQNWAGCSQVDSPNDYSDVSKEEYETVKDSYESDSGREHHYTYREGNESGNPRIDATIDGHTLCFHNDGFGELLEWTDPEDREDGKERQASSTSASNFYHAIKNGSDLESYAEKGWDTSIPEWAEHCSDLRYYLYYAPYKETDSGKTISGCMGIVLYCGGHKHYGCEHGHDLPVCYGHTDLTMSVSIGSLSKIFEMGGVPVVERNSAGNTTSDTIYGMPMEEFEKLTPEEQEQKAQEYLENQDQEEGGGGDE